MGRPLTLVREGRLSENPLKHCSSVPRLDINRVPTIDR